MRGVPVREVQRIDCKAITQSFRQKKSTHLPSGWMDAMGCTLLLCFASEVEAQLGYFSITSLKELVYAPRDEVCQLIASLSEDQRKNLDTDDISKILSKLKRLGVISAKGNKRSSVYFISKEYQSKITKNSLDNGGNSLDNGGNSLDNEQTLTRDELLAVFDNNLKTLIIETSAKKRWDLGSILQLIPQICKGRYFTLYQLSILLNRNKEHIRTHYIQYLVALGKLQKRCKEDNAPKQAYTAIDG